MKKIALLLLIILNVFFTAVVYSESVNRELSNNLLRLHIIANSNCEYDTKIKLSVRDKINETIGMSNFESKEEVIEKLYILEGEINEFLEEKNVDYGCSIKYSTSDFPQKEYNNISMPSGRYECIKVYLGEAKGENWWCVAYPPLCFSEAVTGEISKKGKDKLSESLSEDAYGIIIKDDYKYEIKFLTVDFINDLIAKINAF